MKSRKVNALMILALCGTLAGCFAAKTTIVESSPYDELNGKTAKLSYDSIGISTIASLNYLTSSAAADASHFANFVDGLVTHNEFGILVLDLAESASHSADYKEFTFKLRKDSNMVWSTYNGKKYADVKASDFVAGARTVSAYTTKSNTFYLIRDFVVGALEYNLYTEILWGLSQTRVSPKYKNLTTPEKQAEWIQEQIEKNYPNVYKGGGYDENPLKASDIADIESGARFGVVADDKTGTVSYHLLQSSMFFPTMLTYSCFLPVNQAFYNEKGAKFGTSARDSILYNGPYTLTKSDDSAIIYSKNKAYHQRQDVIDRGFMQARVDKVKINLVAADVNSAYIRQEFENGNIDGFSLSTTDKEGWKKYITGPDDSGTYDDPYSGLVNSRFLDTIGNCYGSNIVLERSSNEKSLTSYYSGGTEASVKNTEKALRLQSVRQAIMAGFDYSTYYQRFDASAEEPDTIIAKQHVVHTFVPRNFVYDDNGNEYTDTYYAQALADNRGYTLEEARAEINAGEYATRQAHLNSVLRDRVDAAMADVALYNQTHTSDPISLPIQIEYYSTWFDEETKMFDIDFLESVNKRLNNVTSVDKDYKNLPYFKVVPTDLVTSKNYDLVSGSSAGNAAFDYSAVQWGWGADYGDPLTYMNTYTIGGDWGGVFNYLKLDRVSNYKNVNGELVESNLLEHYTEIVREGQDINDNLTARYTKFAQAEVELIEELAIYCPQVNYGQGWAWSISKAAGYETPTSNYGLSSDRLIGMWVLTEPLNREERQAIRAKYEAAKEEYKKSHPAIDIYGE